MTSFMRGGGVEAEQLTLRSAIKKRRDAFVFAPLFSRVEPGLVVLVVARRPTMVGRQIRWTSQRGLDSALDGCSPSMLSDAKKRASANRARACFRSALAV